MHITIGYTDLVRKPVTLSVTYDSKGFQPGLLAGENLRPGNLASIPRQEEYA